MSSRTWVEMDGVYRARSDLQVKESIRNQLRSTHDSGMTREGDVAGRTRTVYYEIVVFVFSELFLEPIHIL